MRPHRTLQGIAYTGHQLGRRTAGSQASQFTTTSMCQEAVMKNTEVHARFWVQKTTRQAVSGGNTQLVVELQPVVRAHGLPGAEGNIDWSKYTPSGNILMTITADGAQEWFEAHLGKDVAITFSDVE